MPYINQTGTSHGRPMKREMTVKKLSSPRDAAQIPDNATQPNPSPTEMRKRGNGTGVIKPCEKKWFSLPNRIQRGLVREENVRTPKEMQSSGPYDTKRASRSELGRIDHAWMGTAETTDDRDWKGLEPIPRCRSKKMGERTHAASSAHTWARDRYYLAAVSIARH